MCNEDPFLNEVEGGKYRSTAFHTIDENGELQRSVGAYFIVDAGMTKRACYVDPMKERLSADEIIFSEWLESIRKDVECAFGILKMRFRILLNRVEYHDPSFVDLIFRCCAILHNMLVHWDGRNVEMMLNERYWEVNDPDLDTPHVDIADKGRVFIFNRQHRVKYQEIRALLKDLPVNNRPLKQYRANRDYLEIRFWLTASFQRQYSSGLVCKPTSSSKYNRLVADVMARMEKESFDSLQVKPSSYVVRRVNGTFKEIGNGLFAGINYRAGQRIAYFRGTVVTTEEYETRENQKINDWNILIIVVVYIKCFESRGREKRAVREL
jgi:hypothetical protein